jgi:hypothetical protein
MVNVATLAGGHLRLQDTLGSSQHIVTRVSAWDGINLHSEMLDREITIIHAQSTFQVVYYPHFLHKSVTNATVLEASRDVDSLSNWLDIHANADRPRDPLINATLEVEMHMQYNKNSKVRS